MTAYLYGAENLNNWQSDTLVISYRFAEYRVNGYEISKYCNPTLTDYLDGNTLRIEYNFENANVIFLPVWGLAGQFGTYKDKGVLTENPFGYSYSSWGNTVIYINAE